MDNQIFNIHNYHIDILNREIFLHSFLADEEESGVDYRSAITFEKNIRYLNLLSPDRILVHMHLPGGDWQDVLGMYDTIKLSQSPTTILAYAKVESASSILFQAANLRILMPNSDVLIHYGSFAIAADSKASIAIAQWTEKENAKMISMYADRCMNSMMAQKKDLSRKQVEKLIISKINNKSDWILDPEMAVYYGFADGILGSAEYPTIDYIKNIK